MTADLLGIQLHEYTTLTQKDGTLELSANQSGCESFGQTITIWGVFQGHVGMGIDNRGIVNTIYLLTCYFTNVWIISPTLIPNDSILFTSGWLGRQQS